MVWSWGAPCLPVINHINGKWQRDNTRVATMTHEESPQMKMAYWKRPVTSAYIKSHWWQVMTNEDLEGLSLSTVTRCNSLLRGTWKPVVGVNIGNGIESCSMCFERVRNVVSPLVFLSSSAQTTPTARSALTPSRAKLLNWWLQRGSAFNWSDNTGFSNTLWTCFDCGFKTKQQLEAACVQHRTSAAPRDMTSLF